MFIKADDSLKNFKVRLLDTRQLPNSYDAFLAGHLFSIVEVTPPSPDLSTPPILELKDVDGNCLQLPYNPHEINCSYELVTTEYLDREVAMQATGHPMIQGTRIRSCCNCR
jgi:hypothetical protein